MAKYIVKRLIMAVIAFIAVSAITFFVMNLIPGGPFTSEKAMTKEVIAKRLSRACEESEGMDAYDYIVINDDLETCVRELHAMIEAARNEPVDLAVVDGDAAFIEIMLDIAVCDLVLHAGDRTRLEHICAAEQLLGIAVRFGLIFAGEILVDIRRLVAVEAEEGLERDIMAVALHIGAAFRAGLFGEIEAGADRAVRDEFAVFAFRADIVRHQRIDLRDTGH